MRVRTLLLARAPAALADGHYTTGTHTISYLKTNGMNSQVITLISLSEAEHAQALAQGRAGAVAVHAHEAVPVHFHEVPHDGLVARG